MAECKILTNMQRATIPTPVSTDAIWIKRVSYARVVLIALLVSSALTAHAFILGELRGNAVLGQSLDVSVMVQANAGEEVSAACMKAEIFQADALQPDPILSLTSVNSSSVNSESNLMKMVRIQSRAVEEPVVTLVLHWTCGALSSRRYVLLSDFVAPIVPTLRIDVPVVEKPPAAEKEPIRPVTKPPIKKPARIKGPSVLKLDHQDFISEPKASLDSAKLLAATEESLLQAKKIEALQGDLKALKAVILKNDVSLTDLRGQLQQAQSERMPVLWFYLMIALLLCCVAVIGWFVWQQRRTKAQELTWWQQSKNGTVTVAPLMVPSQLTEKISTESFAVAKDTEIFDLSPPNAAKQEEVDLDIDLDIDLDSLAVDQESFAPPQLSAEQGTGAGQTIRLSQELIPDIDLSSAMPGQALESGESTAVQTPTVNSEIILEPLAFEELPVPNKPAEKPPSQMLELDFSIFETEPLDQKPPAVQ